ncbi:hypothetical protein IT575_07565 [bacterium]|nr:hypothetical protein [bacterium]
MRNKTALSTLALWALLALGGLSGCPGPKPEDKGNQNGRNVALEEGGTLRLPLSIAVDEPAVKGLDLAEPSLWALARAIELPLVKATADGSISPAAASAWTPGEGARSYSLQLATAPGQEADPDYLGKLLLAHWEEILRGEDSPLKMQLADQIAGALDFSVGKGESISGLSLNSGSLEIQLNRPNQLFLQWLSQPGLGILEVRELPAAEGAAPAGGYGPFVISAVRGQVLQLSRNPLSMLGQPRLEQLDFVCEPDRMLQMELFRGGQLDSANVPMMSAASLEFDSALAASAVAHETAAQILCSFDHHQFPWGDQEFQPKTGLRQSLNWSISREGLVEDFGKQFSMWPHFLPGSMQSDVDPALISSPIFPSFQKVEESRAAQKEADHEQGGKLLPGMDLAYVRDSDLDRLADDILRYWNEVSVKMEPFPLTRAELNQRLELGSTEIVLEKLMPAYPDPDALFYPALYGPLAHKNGRAETLTGRGGNHSLLDNKDVNKLIADYQAETDAATRRRVYQQLGKLLEERAYFVFLGSFTPTLLISERLGGYSLTPYDFDASLAAQDFTALGVASGSGSVETQKSASAGH